MALAHYRIGKTLDGKAIAVPLVGGNIARVISDKGSDDLMNELAREYRRDRNLVPTAGALGDARRVLLGEADDVDAEECFLRVARTSDGSVVLDLGDDQGRAVMVRPGKPWEILQRSPVVFRRSKATGAFPMPQPDGDLEELRELLNVSDDDWDLLVAWMVTVWIFGIPHAVLNVNGEAGTGKSDATRMIVTLLDPTSAPLRSMPTNERDWSVTASGAWTFCLENLTQIPEWLSNAICRAVTGSADVRRGLYSDDDLHVIRLMRVIVLNGIEVGGIRPDLASRTFRLDLQRISKGQRLTEAEVSAKFEAMRPRLFGALLDLLSETLAVVERGDHVLKERPRMADIAEWLNAVDIVRDTSALRTFIDSNKNAAAEIAEGDPVVEALRKSLEESGKLSVRLSPSEWLAEINKYHPDRKPRSWPETSQYLTMRITLSAPALAEAGWTVKLFGKSNGKRYHEFGLPRVESGSPDKGRVEERVAASGSPEASQGRHSKPKPRVKRARKPTATRGNR